MSGYGGNFGGHEEDFTVHTGGEETVFTIHTGGEGTEPEELDYDDLVETLADEIEPYFGDVYDGQEEIYELIEDEVFPRLDQTYETLEDLAEDLESITGCDAQRYVQEIRGLIRAEADSTRGTVVEESRRTRGDMHNRFDELEEMLDDSTETPPRPEPDDNQRIDVYAPTGIIGKIGSFLTREKSLRGDYHEEGGDR